MKIGVEPTLWWNWLLLQLTAFYFKVEQVKTEECFEMPEFVPTFTVLL